MEIASAKANLWKKFREGGEDLSEREVTAWEAIRTSVMELEEEGRWREPEEEAEKLARVKFVMRKGALFGGGQVQDEDQVHGGAREGDDEGVQDQAEEMGSKDHVDHDLEGGQGLHGGPGNPQGEQIRDQRRGTKRGLCEGGRDERGGMAHGGGDILVKNGKECDQSDQSVSARKVSENVSISRFKWGEAGEQDQGGHVQGGETTPGREGGTTVKARKVSAKNVPMSKIKIG